MSIYLPIAEISVNVFIVVLMGGLVGFLSGLFGIGGGFLMTPMLLLIGTPAAVAVATGANQIVGASVSGVLAHWRRGNVDFRMGLVLLAGGMAGSSIGVWLFTVLKQLGQIDVTIKVCYVVLLGIVGVLMLVESANSIFGKRRQAAKPKRRQHSWLQLLPWRMRFRRSHLYISVLPPLAIGFVVGVLVAIMGVGGGFIMVPAMIYILGMRTRTVVGTSLFQIIFVTANVTILQAVNNQAVDVVLALLLLLGAVSGAQLGVRAATRLPAAQMRGLLALLVVAVSANIAYELTVKPTSLYTVAPATGGESAAPGASGSTEIDAGPR